MARKRVLSLLMAAFLIAGATVAVAQASTHGRSHRHDGDHGQGGGPATSFDAIAGSLDNMFNFRQDDGARKLFLDPSTGQPTPW